MIDKSVSTYGFGCTMRANLEDAIRRTIDALKQEGFGVLTTIDVQATFKTKIGADFKPYVILGACNPHLAHRALQAEEELGLLLPCNVIVYDNGDNTSRVSIIDPLQMMSFTQNPALAEIAAEANSRLQRVLKHLEA
jgi:uncharacterized protein (DUF302 family)